jgi:tetratricopeptide (TPR) repeat protein
MGDTEEALRLLRQLEETARARGARTDRAIYVYGIAQVHAAAEAWPDALQAFELAEQLRAELHDESGVAYAQQGSAAALLRLKRPGEALPRLERSLTQLATLNDPNQVLTGKIQVAETLTALADYIPAAGVLAALKEPIAASGTEYQQADWFAIDASVQSHLGHWQRAYESLAAWRDLAQKHNAQRMSLNAARLRMQFNRERDATELRAMQRLNT